MPVILETISWILKNVNVGVDRLIVEYGVRFIYSVETTYILFELPYFLALNAFLTVALTICIFSSQKMCQLDTIFSFCVIKIRVFEKSIFFQIISHHLDSLGFGRGICLVFLALQLSKSMKKVQIFIIIHQDFPR